MYSRTNSPPAAYDDIDTARDTEESNTIPGIPLFTDTEESNTIPRTDNRSPINVVLVGKTGAGKSYTGNYLLGKPVFLSMSSTNSITSKCYTETKELYNGITIKVIDTPGLFDTRQTIAETFKERYSLFCLTEPGPHAFLYVIRLDERITDECKCSFNLFREIFGQNINKHLILVLNRIPKDRDSKLMIQESKYLMNIITECHGRYVCLDYVETPSYGNCDGHLLKMILDTFRDNDGSHYTREMYSRAIEPYNAKLKLEEDNRKLSQQVQELTGLLAKQELKNKRTGCVERGRIRDDQYAKIQRNYTTLLKHIVNPAHVCRELFSALVFDEDDKEIIESEKVRIKQADKLLMTLTMRGPRAFDELLLALSATNHHQAKQILEQDECEDFGAIKDKRYFVMKIKFPDLQYHSEYSDPNSDKYKELNDKLETLFKEYGCDATVTILSPGSVIVSLVFATSTSKDEDSLLAILHKVLTSGYLGEYKVSTDNFLFRRIGEWLTNSNTNNTDEVIPVIGDKNTVSLTEQHGDGVIVDCVLSTTSKSELNNFYPILEIILKSGRFDQNQVSADQFSFHQIGGWLNEKPETTTDKQGAVLIDEQATLPGKMKTDKPEPSSKTDTSSASDVSLIRYTEPSVPCTDSTEQAMSRTGSMEVLDNKELRVILVGKTGGGKSALGNSLLGGRHFDSSIVAHSVSSRCQYGSRNLQNGKRLVVIDTPGLFDTRETNADISKELIRCIALASPGPHAFLYVMPIGRFSREELITVGYVKALFGEHVMQFVTLVFTGKDQLDYHEITLEEYIKGSPPQLQSLFDTCDRRVAIINNHSPESKEEDVNEILRLVEQTILSNGGKHYTSDVFQSSEKVYQITTSEAALNKHGKRMDSLEMRELFRKEVADDDGVLVTLAKDITKVGTVISQTVASAWLKVTDWL